MVPGACTCKLYTSFTKPATLKSYYMNIRMWYIMFLVNFFEEKYVKTERAKSGRASPEKGDIMWNEL